MTPQCASFSVTNNLTTLNTSLVATGKTASTLKHLNLKRHDASWLVHLSLDQEVWVRALGPRDVALCSWARHLTLTVPLSTQVSTCKWVPCDRLKILPRGGGGTVCRNTSWYRNWVKLQPDGPLRSFADFYNLPTLNYHVFQLCQRVKQQPKTKTFLP